MQLTPFYKSLYWWLAVAVYFAVCAIITKVFDPSWFRIGIATVVMLGYLFWLSPLASKAQIEDDWKLPKTPRIPIE